jgi:hypothetical protein
MDLSVVDVLKAELLQVGLASSCSTASRSLPAASQRPVTGFPAACRHLPAAALQHGDRACPLPPPPTCCRRCRVSVAPSMPTVGWPWRAPWAAPPSTGYSTTSGDPSRLNATAPRDRLPLLQLGARGSLAYMHQLSPPPLAPASAARPGGDRVGRPSLLLLTSAGCLLACLPALLPAAGRWRWLPPRWTGCPPRPPAPTCARGWAGAQTTPAGWPSSSSSQAAARQQTLQARRSPAPLPWLLCKACQPLLAPTCRGCAPLGASHPVPWGADEPSHQLLCGQRLTDHPKLHCTHACMQGPLPQSVLRCRHAMNRRSCHAAPCLQARMRRACWSTGA